MRSRPRLRLAALAAAVALTAVAAGTVSSTHASAAPPAPEPGTGDGGVSTQIVGGRPAGEPYPFMVSLQKKKDGSHFCGGAVITTTWLLTARHCVEGRNASQVQARVGSPKLNQGGQLVTRLNRIVMHPSGDIALVELAEAVSAGAPVSISTISPPVGTPVRILGWGQMCPQPGACEPR
jgi:secreted trypsin-like serine protease